MRTVVKVPEERIAVVMGTRKSTVRHIAKETGTKISKEENDIIIEGDALDVWNAQHIVKAIGRGFSPHRALALLDHSHTLEIIDLTDYCKDSQIERIKGRVIGMEGKSRKAIEQYTGALVSVYGKTVSVIGQHPSVSIAKAAIMMLIEGSNHSTVYKLLERERKRQVKDIL